MFPRPCGSNPQHPEWCSVALVPPKLIVSSLAGTDDALASNFDGGALILVSCEDWPCHDEAPDPGALVDPSHGV
eukprot:2470352-Prorocentrum_lima.AAC.1